MDSGADIQADLSVQAMLSRASRRRAQQADVGNRAFGERREITRIGDEVMAHHERRIEGRRLQQRIEMRNRLRQHALCTWKARRIRVSGAVARQGARFRYRSSLQSPRRVCSGKLPAFPRLVRANHSAA